MLFRFLFSRLTYTTFKLIATNLIAFYIFISKCRCLLELNICKCFQWNCNTTAIRQPQKCGRWRSGNPINAFWSFCIMGCSPWTRFFGRKFKPLSVCQLRFHNPLPSVRRICHSTIGSIYRHRVRRSSWSNPDTFGTPCSRSTACARHCFCSSSALLRKP